MARFKDLILTELGNTTDTFNYRLDKAGSGLVKYEFKTPEHEYMVFLHPGLEDSSLKVDFETKENRYDETNEGNQFKVIATVMEITKKVWQRREELFDSYLSKIEYDSAQRDKERGTDRNARERLYRTFIKQQFPNAKIVSDGVDTVILPPETD